MDFDNKYTITAGEKYIYLDDQKKEVIIDKILISKEAFAIGEMIENLIKKIEHMRVSFIK